MRKLVVPAAAAALVALLGSPGSFPARAAPMGAPAASAAVPDPLVQPAKGRGHAYGHRKHRNRGLHRGWFVGRGNPHR